METKINVGYIGHGTIGGTLHRRLSGTGDWDTRSILTSKGLLVGGDRRAVDIGTRAIREFAEGIQLAFLAIPTKDDGTVALRYIELLLELGVLVVTSEKGALANYFHQLRPNLHRIGHTATVGGGSGILGFLQSRVNSRTSEVHGIVNGTLNFIWEGVAGGNPLGHVVAEATRLGYAEPGESDPIKIITGEAVLDVTKKAAIAYNLCLNPQEPLRAEDINVTLTRQMVERALHEARSRRFIVTFQRWEDAKTAQDGDELVAFRYVHGGWALTGGFRSLRDPLVSRLSNASPGVNNGVLVVQGENGSDGANLCVGLGAGPNPTTAAMIHDAEQLLGTAS